MAEQDAQTTGYRYNNRRSPDGGSRQADPRWDPAIRLLVERDFAFLPLRYAGDGCLFRGLDATAAEAFLAGELILNRSEHSLAALERDLGVMLMSQDLSDALAVARPWDADGAALILAIPTREFASAADAGRAAVLGFADPGVVFRYPFLCGPCPARVPTCWRTSTCCPANCSPCLPATGSRCRR